MSVNELSEDTGMPLYLQNKAACLVSLRRWRINRQDGERARRVSERTAAKGLLNHSRAHCVSVQTKMGLTGGAFVTFRPRHTMYTQFHSSVLSEFSGRVLLDRLGLASHLMSWATLTTVTKFLRSY